MSCPPCARRLRSGTAPLLQKSNYSISGRGRNPPVVQPAKRAKRPPKAPGLPLGGAARFETASTALSVLGRGPLDSGPPRPEVPRSEERPPGSGSPY